MIYLDRVNTVLKQKESNYESVIKDYQAKESIYQDIQSDLQNALNESRKQLDNEILKSSRWKKAMLVTIPLSIGIGMFIMK